MLDFYFNQIRDQVRDWDEGADSRNKIKWMDFPNILNVLTIGFNVRLNVKNSWFWVVEWEDEFLVTSFFLGYIL